jgi:nicotinamide mononucleotide adenylyltransferase
MLVYHRAFTVRPGTIARQMALYKEFGLATKKRHLGEPLAYLLTESGDVNSYVQVWVYKDAADRTARRAAMAADPEWQTYIQKSVEAGYLVSQRNSLRIPADFAPMGR